MAVYVKVSDVIKLMKSLRNDGYKEVTFSPDEGDPEDELPPAIQIYAIDPDDTSVIVDCDEIEGRIVND